MSIVQGVLEDNSLVFAFALVGIMMIVSSWMAKTLTRGKVHASALAIVIGLILAYLGGHATGGEKGLSDVAIFSGLAVMGGSMLRDFAIIATAYGVDTDEIKRAGSAGVVSLAFGVFGSFLIGAAIAFAFGYRDPETLATLGGGAASYIVGPVVGTAVGASSGVIAMSVAAGLIKAVLVMVCTPMLAKVIGLNNPKSAIAFGGLMGTTSGVAGGLAAVDKRLVPYGAMTATFYTGLCCLAGPSVVYFAFKMLLG